LTNVNKSVDQTSQVAMEENKNTSEKLVDAVGNWLETYRLLMTARVVEHASHGASVGILSIIALLTLIFILLFLGLGSAWWVGETLDNMKAGFFIVGAFYLTLLIIILAIAKKILLPAIRNIIIKKIYEQNH
jgi:hypothetical protein